jgi:hypothetical protein
MKDACSLVCSFVRSGSRSFAPTVHSCFAAARRRRQGRPSRKPRHNVRLREAAPWTVASTAAGLHGSGRRRSDDRARHVGARNALYAKPTMCARMHRSQFPFRTSLQCGGMGTGTPITCRDCCAIKLRERAYDPALSGSPPCPPHPALRCSLGKMRSLGSTRSRDLRIAPGAGGEA